MVSKTPEFSKTPESSNSSQARDPKEVFWDMIIGVTQEKTTISEVANYVILNKIDLDNYPSPDFTNSIIDAVQQKVEKIKAREKTSAAGDPVISALSSSSSKPAAKPQLSSSPSKEQPREGQVETRTRARAVFATTLMENQATPQKATQDSAQNNAEIVEPAISQQSNSASSISKDKVDQESHQSTHMVEVATHQANTVTELENSPYFNKEITSLVEAEKELKKLFNEGCAASVVWRSRDNGKVYVSGDVVGKYAKDDPAFKHFSITDIEALKENFGERTVSPDGKTELPQIITNQERVDFLRQAEKLKKDHLVTLISTREEAVELLEKFNKRFPAKNRELPCILWKNKEGELCVTTSNSETSLVKHGEITIRDLIGLKNFSNKPYDTHTRSHALKPITEERCNLLMGKHERFAKMLFRAEESYLLPREKEQALVDYVVKNNIDLSQFEDITEGFDRVINAIKLKLPEKNQ